MDVNIIALILGLAVIAVVGTLIWRSIESRTPSSASFSIAKIFETKVQFGVEERRAAETAIAHAEENRQQRVGEGVAVLHRVGAAKPTRVLWVDDNPDYNVHETVALEELGLFVTKATSTEAALLYSSYMSFGLVITDLGRLGNAKAGRELIEDLRARGLEWPVIVYTVNAASHRNELTNVGAAAVVDTPAQLLAAATRVRP